VGKKDKEQESVLGLTTSERRFISVVQHRAQCSIAEIARAAGCSERVARYTLDSLRERKILTRQAYLDVYRLGLSYSTLFFSLMPDSKKKTRQLVQYLKQSPRVSYFVALGGDFDFCIDVCVRETLELLDFMQALSNEFGALFNTKSHTSMLSLTDYPLILGGGERREQSCLSCGLGDKTRVAIDQIDHQILSLLSNSPEATARDFSKDLGIAKSTLEYRISRLEKRGIIRGYRYFLDSSKFGLQSFVHCVYLRGVSKRLRNLLIQFCEQNPSISYHLECAGDWDFEFGTSVYTAHEVIDILDDLQERFGVAISRVRTIPFFLHHKVSKYPFPATWTIEQIFGVVA
jgi:DNA-binding Lrp family transcriptional regulator